MKNKAYLMTMMIVASMICACMPTPDKDMVINKSETSIVLDNPDYRLSETLNAIPKQWNDTLLFRDETVSVEINAVIETPIVDSFPIVEVKPASIDPQIAAQLLYKLVPNGSIRISDHGGNEYSLEDIDQWIEEVKQLLAHTDEITFDSIEERDRYINTQNAELERLFEMRKTAVSGTVTSLSNYELLGRYGSMECRILDADGMECANFMWKPQTTDNSDKRESVLHIDSLTPSCGLLDHGVQSKEEALQAADQLIHEIGLKDHYVCVSVIEGTNTIRCYYSLQYSGISSSPFTETVIDFTQTYQTPWPNEMLLVCFYKSEGRTTVSLVCPSEIIGEIGNAELLPFETIQAQFEKSIKAAYSWFDECITSAEITINRISLGYYRTPLKDNPNRYLLIPAWTFEGTRITYEKSDPGNDQYTNQNDLPNNVLMILNGIDGSLLYAG